MGTKPKKTQTTIVNSEKEFYELLTSPGTEVTNLIFPNEEVAWVSWKYSEDNVTTGKNVNVAVAAYVTTQARLKLYGYFSKLGKCFILRYKLIYVQKVDEFPKITIGDYLGDLTDELEVFGSGSLIDEFVSGAPKNYAFSVICLSTGKRTTKCKVKRYNFELLKFKSCKLYFCEKHDSGRRATCTCSQCQKDQKETWWHSSVRVRN